MPLFENLGKIINDKDTDCLKNYYDFSHKNKDDIVADDLVEVYINPLHYTYKDTKPMKEQTEKPDDDDEEYEEGTVEYVLNYIIDACSGDELNKNDLAEIYKMVDESEQFKLFLKVLSHLSKKVKNSTSSDKLDNKDDDDDSCSSLSSSENIYETINPVYENNNMDCENNHDADSYQINVII